MGQSKLFDAGTIRHLKDLGLLSGWRCAEIGAATEAIAIWLAARVRRPGRVVVADLDERLLEGLGREGLEVRRHDIKAGPLDEAAYDLVHSRLAGMPPHDRERALDHMVASLRPGGWLLAEDEDFGTVDEVMDALRSAGLEDVSGEAGVAHPVGWGRKPRRGV